MFQSVADRALDLFVECYDLDSETRDERLRAACGGDLELRAAVAALLRCHDAPATILGALEALHDSGRGSGSATPARVGPYLILDELGRGGMGVVYRAVQPHPRRTVALKLLPSEQLLLGHAERFTREVEVLGLLQHPGIARIYEAGTADLGGGMPTPYFAMEYVDGVHLLQFGDERALDVRARCELIARVCDAVQHAHDRGVVHRDLKPLNILVVPGVDGAGPQPKVLDFGIARLLESDSEVAVGHTRTGTVLGTLFYMSPEQFGDRAAAVDARSDVYALGVLLFELLTGRLPHELRGRTLPEIARTVTEAEPMRLSRIDRRLRGDLDTIAGKALARSREERYGSAREFAADLRCFLQHQPISAQPQTVGYQLRKFARRNRTLVGGVIATFVALVAGLVVALSLSERNQALAASESAARKTAETARDRLRSELYAAQMRLGGQAMQAPSGSVRVRELATAWLPGSGDDDPRGFEWYLLWASCTRAAVVADSIVDAHQFTWLPDGGGLRTSGSKWCDERGGAVRSLAGDVVAASFDGRIAARRTAVDRYQILDVPSGEVRFELAAPRGFVRTAMSPDGALFGAFDLARGGAAVWETRAGSPVAEFPSRGSGCYEITFSGDGEWFAMTYPRAGGAVGVWRVGEWAAPRHVLDGPRGHTTNVRFDHSARHLAWSSREGEVVVWQVESGERVFDRTIRDKPLDVDLRPDGQRVAVACDDHTVRLFDLDGGEVDCLRGHDGAVASVAWSPAGDLLASGGTDGKLCVWSFLGTPVHLHLPSNGKVRGQCHQLRWDPDGRWVSSRARHATLDLVSGTEQEGETEVACGGARVRFEAPTLRIHADGSGAGIPVHEQRLAPAACMAVHPVLPRVAVGGRGGITLFEVGRDEIGAQRDRGIEQLLWSPDGRWLLQLGSDRVVRFLDGETLATVEEHTWGGGVRGVSLTPDPDVLAVACEDATVRIGSRTRGELATLRGHFGAVLSVAVSSDGRRVASGGRDRTVRIWDFESGAELMALAVDDHVAAVAWSPDGRSLAAVGAGGAIDVWNARESQDTR